MRHAGVCAAKCEIDLRTQGNSVMRRKVSDCLPLLLILTFVGGAIAQVQYTPWSPTFETRLRSSITEATVTMLIDAFELSAAQENAVRHTFHAHRAAFEEFVAEHEPVVREVERAVQRTQRATLERLELNLEREKRFAEIADDQAALDQQFFEEAKAVLTEEQLEDWDAFQRRYERAAYLRPCRSFPEEGIDQVALLEELLSEDSLNPTEWLAERPDVAEFLLNYELALADPLSQWVKLTIRQARQWDRRRADRMHVADNGRTYVGEYRSRRVQVRFERELRRIHQLRRELVRVNRNYHRILTGVLPEDLSRRFNQSYVVAALCGAGIQATMPARDFVEEILESEHLTADQRNAIEAQLLAYEHAVPELNRRVIRARDVFAAAQLPGGRTSHTRREKKALEEQWKKTVDSRLEAERKLIETAYALLTPEQQDEVDVPEVPEPRY